MLLYCSTGAFLCYVYRVRCGAKIKRKLCEQVLSEKSQAKPTLSVITVYMGFVFFLPSLYFLAFFYFISVWKSYNYIVLDGIFSQFLFFFGKYLCFTNNEEQIHAANNLFIYSIKIEWKNATKRAGCETDDCSNSENFLLFVWHMIFFFLTIIVQQICFNPRSAWIDCERMDNAKLDIRNICKPLFA